MILQPQSNRTSPDILLSKIWTEAQGKWPVQWILPFRFKIRISLQFEWKIKTNLFICANKEVDYQDKRFRKMLRYLNFVQIRVNVKHALKILSRFDILSMYYYVHLKLFLFIRTTKYNNAEFLFLWIKTFLVNHVLVVAMYAHKLNC